MSNNSIVDIVEYLCEKWVQYNTISADSKSPLRRSELLGQSTSTVASMQGDLCAVVLQGSTSIVCATRTKWPDVCKLTIVNVDSGRKIKEFSVQLSLSCMTYDLRFRQNLLFGTNDGRVGIIDIVEKRALTSFLIEGMKAIDFIAYTAAGQMIACKQQDNRLAVIDLSTNNPVHMIECDKDISALSCSATGNHLLVGCIDGSVYHWDVRQPI